MSTEQATPFGKKTIYHSQLVAAGTVEGVLITSDVMPSKYKKEGMPNTYVSMKINGKEHQYIVENETVEAKLKGLKGQVVSLTATGGREDADISVYPVAGPASRLASSARAAQPPPSNNTPASPTTVHEAKLVLLQCVNARIMSTEAALLVQGFINNKHGAVIIDEEHFQGITSCFFIALDRKGLVDTMPKVLPEKLFTPEKPPQLPPPPPPPQAPEPDEDEIPF